MWAGFTDLSKQLQEVGRRSGAWEKAAESRAHVEEKIIVMKCDLFLS